MHKLTIDGVEVEVPGGTNLIQAADRAGIEIPHYCYHPGLSVVGNCRMCLVEVEKVPKLQIACNTRAADGMVVHTKSDRTIAAQKAVLEFLLINHPIDCPVCDQAGECKLQDYYMEFDGQASRFDLGRKIHKGKAIDIGSGVMLDQERCILCARCTRFFDEVTHTGELAIVERGDRCRIETAPGRRIENPYAGNVVDICPVGALTEKDFRFRMRVWYLHRTPSVCAGCERGCAIDIHHHRGRIYRLKPRFNSAVNGYWMCDEGRHGFAALQSESRLRMPLAQSGDSFSPQPWTAALRQAALEIGSRRDSSGPRAIGAIIGAQSTNEEAFALKRLMTETIGSDRLARFRYSPPGASGDDDLLIRADKNPNARGLEALGIRSDGVESLAQAARSGELKALIALRADLVKMLGEREFMSAFGSLDYFLLLDTDASETARMANQIFPIAAWPELDGSFTNFAGRVQRLNRAFPPPGESLPAIEAIARLTRALDGGETATEADAVFCQMALTEPAFGGMTLGGLGPHGADLNSPS